MSQSLARPAESSRAAPAATIPAAARLCALAIVLLVLAAVALTVDLSVAGFVKLGNVPGDLKRLVGLSEAFAYGGTVGLIILLAVFLDSVSQQRMAMHERRFVRRRPAGGPPVPSTEVSS